MESPDPAVNMAVNMAGGLAADVRLVTSRVATGVRVGKRIVRVMVVRENDSVVLALRRVERKPRSEWFR